MSFYSIAESILEFLVRISPPPLKSLYTHAVFTNDKQSLPDHRTAHFETYALVLGGIEGRVEIGARLYKQGIADKIIVSGGIGPFTERCDLPEAEALKEELLRDGVPENDIIIEAKSTNTLENIRNTLKTLAYIYGEGTTTCFNLIVVTSNFHLKRSIALLRNQLKSFPNMMVNVYWFGCPYPSCEVHSWRHSQEGRHLVAKELIRIIQYRLTHKI